MRYQWWHFFIWLSSLNLFIQVGSNKFAKMNYMMQSLQDGPAKTDFFGGKSLIVGGDMKQLPPGEFGSANNKD